MLLVYLCCIVCWFGTPQACMPSTRLTSYMPSIYWWHSTGQNQTVQLNRTLETATMSAAASEESSDVFLTPELLPIQQNLEPMSAWKYYRVVGNPEIPMPRPAFVAPYHPPHVMIPPVTEDPSVLWDRVPGFKYPNKVQTRPPVLNKWWLPIAVSPTGRQNSMDNRDPTIVQVPLVGDLQAAVSSNGAETLPTDAAETTTTEEDLMGQSSQVENKLQPSEVVVESVDKSLTEGVLISTQPTAEVYGEHRAQSTQSAITETTPTENGSSEAENYSEQSSSEPTTTTSEKTSADREELAEDTDNPNNDASSSAMLETSTELLTTLVASGDVPTVSAAPLTETSSDSMSSKEVSRPGLDPSATTAESPTEEPGFFQRAMDVSTSSENVSSTSSDLPITSTAEPPTVVPASGEPSSVSSTPAQGPGSSPSASESPVDEEVTPTPRPSHGKNPGGFQGGLSAHEEVGAHRSRIATSFIKNMPPNSVILIVEDPNDKEQILSALQTTESGNGPSGIGDVSSTGKFESPQEAILENVTNTTERLDVPTPEIGNDTYTLSSALPPAPNVTESVTDAVTEKIITESAVELAVRPAVSDVTSVDSSPSSVIDTSSSSSSSSSSTESSKEATHVSESPSRVRIVNAEDVLVEGIPHSVPVGREREIALQSDSIISSVMEIINASSKTDAKRKSSDPISLQTRTRKLSNADIFYQIDWQAEPEATWLAEGVLLPNGTSVIVPKEAIRGVPGVLPLPPPPVGVSIQTSRIRMRRQRLLDGRKILVATIPQENPKNPPLVYYYWKEPRTRRFVFLNV